MVAMGHWPSGFDPYALIEELRPIIENNGGTTLDILSHFRSVSKPENNFYQIDGHPTADGHLLLSKFIAEELTKRGLPGLE